MALTDTALKALKPKEKAYVVGDDRSLYAEVLPTGAIVWRFRSSRIRQAAPGDVAVLVGLSGQARAGGRSAVVLGSTAWPASAGLQPRCLTVSGRPLRVCPWLASLDNA
jgi:hypothetical protein